MKKKVLLFLLLLIVSILFVSCGLGLVDPAFESEFALSINGNNNSDYDDDSFSGGGSSGGGSSGSGDGSDYENDEIVLLAQQNKISFLEHVSNREGEATVSLVLGSSIFSKTYNINGSGELDSTGKMFTIDVPDIGSAVYEFYRLVSYDDNRRAYYKKVSSNIEVKGLYKIVENYITPMLDDILTDYYGLDFTYDDAQKLYVYSNKTSDPDGNTLVFEKYYESLDMRLEKK